MIKHGLLTPCRYEFSPNYNQRPEGTDIDLVVLHNISLPPNQFGGPDVIDLFLNRLDITAHEAYQELIDLKVSTHLFIRRDGELIQCVPFHLRAWHAGVSQFEGRENCNDFSIGIELEGCDDLPFENCQYQVLMKVLKQLILNYPKITQKRIVGHSDVAPGRKTDPGPWFDWTYLNQLMSEELCS
jgi:AmpD protein